MKIEKIYVIRAWVDKTTSSKKYQWERIYQYEKVIINSLEMAKLCYNEAEFYVKNGCLYKGCYGKAMLFEPHIFDDGILASWPDGEYILQYEKGE